jgi:hypothetical protein
MLAAVTWSFAGKPLNSLLKSAAIAGAWLLGASRVVASTALGDYVTFSGFGTLGEVVTDTDDDIQFVRDREAAGASRRPSFNVDSDLGLQLTAQPTKWLSGTVQTLTEQRSDINLSTEVEWAFVKLEPLDGLALRGGRMALPMFLISDTRYVGYANTWLRPPDEVYALALLDRFQGADLSYRLPIGSTSLSMSVLAGASSISSPGLPNVNVRDVNGVNAQWESEWVTLRAGRVTGKVQIPPSEDHYTFSDLGAVVDHNNIVAQAEYVMRRSEYAPGSVDANGWYLLGGYRFNAVLPYAIYANARSPGSSSFHLQGDQSTVAAGVRWDAFKSAAIKFQVERVDTHDTIGVSFVTPIVSSPIGLPPISAPVTRPVAVFSLAVDFVF